MAMTRGVAWLDVRHNGVAGAMAMLDFRPLRP
jgi:hypothetical protein